MDSPPTYTTLPVTDYGNYIQVTKALTPENKARIEVFTCGADLALLIADSTGRSQLTLSDEQWDVILAAVQAKRAERVKSVNDVGKLPARYLGDGAYAESRGFDLCVYTSNGLTRTEGVFLGDVELARLVEFARAEGLLP